MRLLELQGVKSLIPNVKKRPDLDSILHDKGFKYLDQGQYGTVWAHPNLNYVLKVFDSLDKGYLKFLEIASNNQSNPHFPKIIGKPIKITDHAMGIRLEKLSPWPASRSPTDMAIDWIIAHLDFPNWKTQLDLPHYKHIKPDVVKLLKKWPQLPNAMLQFVKFEENNPGLGLDLSNDNIMMRGDCPVIVDPFAII